MLFHNGHLETTETLTSRSTAANFRGVDWQGLARANTHPLRVSILEVFGIDGGRTMSASDLSYELRTPLANVNYHLTELAKQGLVALSRRKRVRGATEHFYRLPGDTAHNGSDGNWANAVDTAAHTHL
jgi:predicted ArsR family transcriptional regulator